MMEKTAGKMNSKYNLTEGSIPGKLLLIALPVIGTQFAQMTYNLTDMFWLGRLSSEAVAASGTAGMFLWLSMGFLLIGRMGAEIGVAQNIGKGDHKSAVKYSQTSLTIAIVLGVLYSLVIILFRHPLIGFFNIREANVAADTRDYLSISGLSMPLTFISAVITGTFNGSGNSRKPFVINAIGLALNIILDPILIFSLNLGVKGAAYATVIAQSVVFILQVISIKFGKNRPFEHYRFFTAPDLKCIPQILKWSLPIGLESIFFTLLTMIISRTVASFGASAIAVSRIGSQIESLSWLIGGGFGMALTSFIGQNYGSGKWERIRKCIRVSSFAMLAWGVCVSLLLAFGARFLFSIFIKEPLIISMGATYLLILAFCQIPMCMEAVSSGAFKGIGKTVPPSIVSVTSNAIRVPLAYFLSKTSLGLDGIWLGVCLGAVLRGLWSYLWFTAVSRKLPREDL